MRAVIEEFYACASAKDAEGLLALCTEDVQYEPLLDPNGWLVEVKGDMVVRATGLPYRNDCLSVFRFRDGKIAQWVTYHDSVRHLIAFGITEVPKPSA